MDVNCYIHGHPHITLQWISIITFTLHTLPYQCFSQCEAILKSSWGQDSIYRRTICEIIQWNVKIKKDEIPKKNGYPLLHSWISIHCLTMDIHHNIHGHPYIALSWISNITFMDIHKLPYVSWISSVVVMEKIHTLPILCLSYFEMEEKCHHGYTMRRVPKLVHMFTMKGSW